MAFISNISGHVDQVQRVRFIPTGRPEALVAIDYHGRSCGQGGGDSRNALFGGAVGVIRNQLGGLLPHDAKPPDRIGRS